MNMTEALVWWVLAGVLVIAELLTGTFYLLMVALGLAAGALAAHAGVSTTLQMVWAGIVGAGAVAVWHVKRSNAPAPMTAAANPDVNLDVGSTVHVADAAIWQSDGSATVHYRGADWSAQLAAGATAQAGHYVIEQVQGSRLILRNA
jgi:membrane protein implicated in regulation of membrane protease activity